MALLVSRLRKSYGSTPALQEVNLVLEDGVVALLGPNGSGKTTLLRCLATSLRPDPDPADGEILWNGYPLWPNPSRVRQHLGYMPQELDFPQHLTPLQLMAHLGQLKGYHDSQQNAALLHSLGLGQVANRPFATLSVGQIRLTGVAQALLSNPTLLLLDEPTRGLDVVEREAVFRQLRRRADRGLTLFSTHVPDDITRMTRQVVVLSKGRVCYAGDVEALRRHAAGQVHEIRVSPGNEIPLPPGCRVSRRVTQADDVVLRVVGPVPLGLGAIEVTPALEDAYLLLLGASG